MIQIQLTHPKINRDSFSFQDGFSLIETLIALILSSLIFLFSLEILTSTQKHFFELKDKEESSTAAHAALDKMRIDISKSGSGLLFPMKMGLLKGIFQNGDSLTVLSRKMTLNLPSGLAAGQTKIRLTESTQKIKTGHKLCIHDGNKGEIKGISSLNSNSIILDSPLNHSYSLQETSVVLLRQVCFFLDEKKSTLRRKVNNAPAQPLLEKVSAFDFNYKKESNLLHLSLSLKQKGEKRYETTLFPKNTAMAQIQ